MFSAIFGMCKDIRTYQQKEREARRKDTRTLKQIAARLELDPLDLHYQMRQLVSLRLRSSSRVGTT